MISNKTNTLRKFGTKTNGTASGAVDEEVFNHAFSNCSSLPMYTSRDLSEYLAKLKDSLSVTSEDWEKRVEGLKNIRNVVHSDYHQMDDFSTFLRSIEQPVDSCLRDLRSQVVREACITVAYLSQKLTNRFDHFAEAIFLTLINLIQNSAKVMSSSSIIAINFIIKNTPAQRLIPIIASEMSSKSNVMRRFLCEFLSPIIELWPIHIIEKHIGLVQESIRKGICDADQDARSASRTAFKLFSSKFPSQANALLQNLDPAKRKTIEKSLGINSSGNTSSASSLTNLATINRHIGSVKRPVRPVLGATAASKNRTGLTGTNTMRAEPRSKQVIFNNGRSRLASKISQSQPASRETSPSSRTGSEYDYIQSSGYGQQASTLSSANNFKKEGIISGVRHNRKNSLSRLPRSHGTSRDNSPPTIPIATQPHINSSLTDKQDRIRRSSGAPVYPRPSITSLSDIGVPTNMSHYYRQRNDSDDNASETSSICSDHSGRSIPSYSRQHTTKVVDNIADIITMLRSSQWSEKKDGLINLQNYLRSEQQLSIQEVNRISLVLSSIFADSSSKVVTLFMGTLQLFIKGYSAYLHDWMYSALVRLLSRQGHETLSNHQKAIQETLSVLRSQFPINLQFLNCCKYIIDDAVVPSLKVKACALEYMKDLVVMMPMDAIKNPSPDIVKAITRVIAWSTEPKSVDVRRLASRVVIKLADLDVASFSQLIENIPQPFHDHASKLLQTYKKTANGAANGSSFDSSPKGMMSASRLPKLPVSLHNPSPITQTFVSQQNARPPSSDSLARHDRALSIPVEQSLYDGNSAYSHKDNFKSKSNNFSSNGVNNHFAPSGGSTYNPVHFSSPNSPGPYGNEDYYRNQALNDQHLQNTNNQHPDQFSSKYTHPGSLLSNFDRNNDLVCGKLKKPVIGYQTLKKIREMLPEDAVSEILQELSNYNERYEQRKACMLKLIKLLREGTVQTWDEHSKPTLLILLESLSDNSGETRALALRVLQELVRTQGDLIRDYACLTVMKILEACKDTDKAVIRSAEECAQTVARFLSKELCLRLLTTIINDASAELSLPAVKMQSQVIKRSSPQLIENFLPDLVPGLIRGCSHDDSSMRKACIFCLVQIAIKFGDDVWGYLEELNAGKKRLLRVYIDKELKENEMLQSP